MNKINQLVLTIFVAMLFTTPLLAQLLESITTKKDCFITSVLPDQNWKGSGLVVELNIANNSWIYSLIYFDLSSVPQNALITEANLLLYCTSNPNDIELTIGRMTDKYWTETGVTWNTKPSDITPPSLKYFNGTNVDSWNAYNVTEFVETWHDGTYFNNGFQLFTYSDGTGAAFFDRESGNNLAPYLEVRYKLPSVTVTSPNGGENWLVGSSQRITATSSGQTNGVEIHYSTNGGATWDYITGYSTPYNSISYDWTVPNTPSTACKMRVTMTYNGGSVSDVSNTNFTISQLVPSVTLTSPNGGENWQGGSSHTITATSSGSITGVTIDYSTNGGSTWNYVTGYSTTDNTINSIWIVPNTPSSNCKVRATVTYIGGSVSDISDNDFTILPESYSFEFFNGQYVVGVGQTLTLQGRVLNQNGNPVSNVTIYAEDPIRLQSVIVGPTDAQGRFSHTLQPGNFISPGIHTLVFYAASSRDYQLIRVLVTDPNSLTFSVNDPEQNTGLGAVVIQTNQLNTLAAVDKMLYSSETFNLKPALTDLTWGLMVRARAFYLAPVEAVVQVVKSNPFTAGAIIITGASCAAVVLFPGSIPATLPICTHGVIELLPDAISLASNTVFRAYLNLQVAAGHITEEDRDRAFAGADSWLFGISLANTGNARLLSVADYELSHFSDIDPDKPMEQSITRDTNGNITGIAFCGVPMASPNHVLMLAVRMDPSVTSVQSDNPESVTKFALHPNYPNPFNPSTKIAYQIPEQAHVTIKIYDIVGQEVRTLVDRNESAGLKEVIFDGKDAIGRPLASGLYFYKIVAGSHVSTKKMILIK